MRSNMSPAAYISPAWFERERELLFRPLWQFIGLKMMLTKHNAFITRILCGISIVVQNFNGELRAFENVCVHRQNPLQTRAQGVRPLVCSYHGWSYAETGAVKHIPFEAELYRYPAQERACMQLRQFAVETIGNLVFINLSQQPLPIAEQFNQQLIASLKESSEVFDSEVLLTIFKARHNWKLAYENLRDSHHPRYLHAGSLYQNVKFQVLIDEAGVTAAKHLQSHGLTDREHALALMRSFSNGGLNEPMQKLTPYAWHQHVERLGDKDWYYNWLAFPNLHIASGSGGYSFIIEHHIPIAADRTDLMVYYVTAKKKRRYASSAAVLHAHIMGAEPVLREDIQVMENIQATLHAGAPSPKLGEFEFANSMIETVYLAVMDGKIVL